MLFRTMLLVTMKRTMSFVFAGPLLVALTLASVSAEAYPLRVWSKTRLQHDFAARHFTTIDRVLEVRAVDLKRVPGVLGFTLGRHKSKDGKWTYAGVVVYAKCGKKKVCISGVRLNGADKVRGLALVDLSAKETRVSLGGGFSLGRQVKEPSRAARRPLLLVEIERTHGKHQTREVTMISLKEIKNAKRLLRVTTLSTTKGEAPTRGRRGRRSRFNGRRVTALRFLRAPGKQPQLEVFEKRISTRFNRCLQPKAEPIRYHLEGSRFVMQPRKGGLPGCR